VFGIAAQAFRWYRLIEILTRDLTFEVSLHRHKIIYDVKKFHVGHEGHYKLQADGAINRGSLFYGSILVKEL
jgi:hypothetical protein